MSEGRSDNLNLDGNATPRHIQPPTSESLASYSVAECQEIGRYLVATRDLKKGEIIFQESPLAVAPQKNSTLICPGCFKTAKVECFCCGWPMCSEEECPGIDRHADVECKLLSTANEQRINKEGSRAKRDMKSFRNWSLLQDTLMTVRCLNHKYSNKDTWGLLLDMDSNWSKWSRSPLYEQALNLVKIIRMEFCITEELYSTDEIMKVMAILDTNAYEVKMPEMNIQGGYKLASLAEHSCTPNAIKTTSSESLLLTLRAAKDIDSGEHISTSYCDILWPTFQRQRYIQWSKFFTCKCPRCLSQTELNSHISSLQCPHCSIGSPVVPVLESKDAKVQSSDGREVWCDTYKPYQCSSCQEIFPANTCERVFSLAESELQEIERDDGHNISRFEEWLRRWTTPPAAPTFISSSKDKCKEDDVSRDMKSNHTEMTTAKGPALRLHPQHALCLDACHTVFLLYGTDSQLLHELKRKESLGMNLLQATTNLFPDIAMFRGTVMYELAITKTSLLTHYVSVDDEDIPDLVTLAKEILWLMSESLEMLKYESEDQPEGHLFTLAVKQLEELRPFLQEMISSSSKVQS